MTGSTDPRLDALERVVWTIEVRDPDQLAAAGVRERTLPGITELAATYGCVLRDCSDDDSYDDAIPYYQWNIVVPREAHLDRDDSGVPRVSAAAEDGDVALGLRRWA
jgi:hypothetical protein